MIGYPSPPNTSSNICMKNKQIKTTATSLIDNLTNPKANTDNRAVVFLIGKIYSVLGVYDDLEHSHRATLYL